MQSTDQLLMIRPVQFGFNRETAVNNSFQADPGKDIQEAALQEFNGLAGLLEENGVTVTVIPDTAEPNTPDSVFPNNWISFHGNGLVMIYPMFASNRRLERKGHVLAILEKKFTIKEIIDLSHYETEGLFLEGTGSMVFDRANRIVYACLSARTSPLVLSECSRLLHYTPVVFHASDESGFPVYHTNVMMCIADRFAVICLDTVKDEHERVCLIDSIRTSGKEIIEISFEQMNAFAGNMLQVKNRSGESLLVMSSQAYRSLSTDQVFRIEKHVRILHSPLKTIESAGGGSARCMLADIFNEPLK